MLFFICYFNNKKGEINQFKVSENLLPTLHKDRVNKLDLDSSGLSVFREVRKGYFRHHSKLLYIKGIGVGQTPFFCHFWIQDLSPPCNYVTSRLISLKFSGNVTFYIYFISQKKHFFWKSTLRLSCRYAIFPRLRLPKGKAEILIPIWCFWIGHKSGYL